MCTFISTLTQTVLKRSTAGTENSFLFLEKTLAEEQTGIFFENISDAIYVCYEYLSSRYCLKQFSCSNRQWETETIFSRLQRLLEIILDDSKGLKSGRVSSFYVPMTWQDTVILPASRVVSAFSKCVENLRAANRADRTLFSRQIRVISPPTLEASLAKTAAGISRDLLATHTAGCPMRTKLGKVSSRKHSVSLPGLLHLLSWVWKEWKKKQLLMLQVTIL